MESASTNFAPITPATLMQLGQVLPSQHESTVMPLAIHDTPQRAKRISQSQNGSQSQTPKADQASLPDCPAEAGPQYIAPRDCVVNGKGRSSGILPADTLDRLRAMKPEGLSP